MYYPSENDFPPLQSTVRMVNHLEAIIDEIGPLPSPPSPPIDEIENELTPPPTPPSPPGPPAPQSPLWSQQEFNFYTNLIQNHLTELEKIVIGPHIIFMDGIQHLRSQTGQNWKDKLHYLLYEARIPFFWVLDIVPDDYEETTEHFRFEEEEEDPHYEESPHRVRLYLISHHVKTKVLNILNNYLRNEYNNIVYIE